VPADKYLSVIAGLNPKYMIGLTGTPDRKDGRHVLTNMVLGPVKVRAKVKTLVPKVRIIETPASTSQNYKTWVGSVNYLSRHKERNKLIARWAVHDVLKNGRSVVIPVERVIHVKELVELINKLAGKTIAAPFTGAMSKAQRDKVRDDAKTYKVKVVVGMRKMVQVGINVPRWDTLYEVMPISNPPNLTQETARIRTVVDGKLVPIIRHFVEDFGPTKGCLRTCVWQTYRPSGFIMSQKDEALAKKYMSKQKVQAKSEGISLW
jgi:superfamily II DNA or RNA helicase